MHLAALKYFFERTVSQNPSFVYRGEFEDYFTGLILDMAEVRNDMQPQGNAMHRRVTFMLVECFQNILKHSENLGQVQHTHDDEGMFCFKNFEDGFVINSVNVIRNAEIEQLEALVHQVNSMSESDLKKYHLDRLEKNSISDKGGAGLGLIELARKSGQKILYKFESLGDDVSLFHQQVTLLLQNHPIEHKFADELEENNVIYKRMASDGLQLVFKGDVSNKALLPLLDFLKIYVSKSPGFTKRFSRAAHVLMEVSQNIAKSGRYAENGNSGLLMLGERDGMSIVHAGNVIGLSEKIQLEQKLQYLNSLDPLELKELHRNTLKASLLFESKQNTGLGLIELMKASSEPVLYNFYPLGDERFLFALAVAV